MELTFACGTVGHVGTRGDERPICPHCGTEQVRAVKVRAPRFVGVATGPLCETKPLEAIPQALATTPLILKTQE